jgi:hypothetical protein
MIKKLFFTVLFLLTLTTISNASCYFNCAGFPGTVCYNNECVPKSSVPTTPPSSTPAPSVPVPNTSEIRLEAKQGTEIVTTVFDCTKLDLNNLKIYLTRRTPPPYCSYYSSVFFFYQDLQKNMRSDYFFSMKDILNNYVFTYIDTKKQTPHPQTIGSEFVFNMWDNPAFADFLKSRTCEELKSSGAYFGYGISINGDMSDYEGAIFTFK